jgi:hypothetical protein
MEIGTRKQAIILASLIGSIILAVVFLAQPNQADVVPIVEASPTPTVVSVATIKPIPVPSVAIPKVAKAPAPTICKPIHAVRPGTPIPTPEKNCVYQATTSTGSGHGAGYEWAAANGITDPNYSNGNSESFNEGVREYAEENQ